MSRVSWRGKTFDARTRDMLVEAEKLSRVKIVPTQGSYSSSVGASAGTHSGGGAVDISVTGLSWTQIVALVKSMRRVGFASWYRPANSSWSPHIHAIAIGATDLAPAARRQVEEWKAGGDGLVGTAADPHRDLGVKPTTWESYLSASSLKPFPLPAGHSFGTPESSTVHDGTSSPDDEHNVKLIQRRLRVQQTGRFGTYTRVKVANWQLWKRIKPTGRVGAATWRAMRL